MSSIGAILNSAITSMQASQLGMSLSSNNIANAQNPDYTRQRLITAPGASIDSRLSIGSGVDIVGVEAIRDRMIDMRRLQETSNKAGSDLTNRTLSDIEVQFTDTDDTGLLQGLSKFFNSFQTLSTDPASSNFRQQVSTSAAALMNQFKTMHDSLVNAKNLVDRSINEKVATVNALAKQIAQVSGQIANQEVNGPANDLRDQRSGLVQQLAGLVDVKELETGDKFYQLSIGNNRLLVFGTDTAPISGQEDLTGKFNSGEIKAAIDLRDSYIPKYLDSLDQMASEIVQQVNAVHSTGYDLNGNTGINFFQPLGSVHDASALMALSAEVSGDPSKIAASSEATGQDNGIAMQLGNLLFQPVFSGGGITDQYRNLVFNVGSDVSDSAVSLKQHEALAQQLDLRRQSVSGVSIDEETVQILQFQRAYQASARLIKTVDELTQTLLNL